MGIKISELTEANQLTEGCCIPVVNNGTTKKIKIKNLKIQMNPNFSIKDGHLFSDGIDIGEVQGANGKTAYELACKYGFVGTEEDFAKGLKAGASSGLVTEDFVKETVNNAVAEIVANAPSDFDTLKEMSDWISEHEDDATAMNSAILENKKDSLESKINRILTDYSLDIEANALRICFVSPTETSVQFGTKTYTCYKSISTAIDTEYPLINNFQLGLLCVVLEGKYIENIRLYGKENVAIIGIDKLKCVIENKATEEHHGYYYPPLWVNPSTTIGGLTINCYKKIGVDTEKDAYCIHTDDDGVGRVLIKNCNMFCEQHACIGFGTREHAPLFIEDCSMIALGKCLYGHNSCGSQITGTVHEELHIYNCYGRSGSYKCIDIFDANNFYPPAGSRPKNLDWLVYMNNNVFLNENSVDSYPTTLHISPYYEEATDKVNYFSKNIRRMPSNKGNNSPFLNYISNDVDKTEVIFTDVCLTATEGGSGCYYVVRNGVCYVTLDVTTINTSGIENIGLPTPLFDQQFSIQPFNTQDKNGIVKLYISGNLQLFSLVNNTRYMITFSYPVA